MRLAIISDIHEDYPRLKRITDKAESLGYDLMVCLGDIAGFSLPFYRYKKHRDASACLDLVREKCKVIIPGNHDLHVARRIPVHSEGFDYPANWYQLGREARTRLGGDRLWMYHGELSANFSTDDLEFINSLPEYHILQAESFNILFSHYAHPNLSGMFRKFYSWEGEFRSHFLMMDNNECRLGVIGHSHPRGVLMVQPHRFRQNIYRKNMEINLPAILVVPPLTRHRKRTGFCIFDTGQLMLNVHH